MQGGKTCEGIADVVKVLGFEDGLDLVKSLTGTLTNRFGALHQNRAIEVVVADNRRRTGEVCLGKLGHLHHLVVVAADVIAQDVIKLAAPLRFGLHIDIAHLAVLIGETGIVAACKDRNRLHGVLEIHIQGAHDRSIDLEAESWGAGDELGIERGEVAAGRARNHQFLSQVIELVEAIGPIAEVIELEVETALGRETRDRWWLGRHRQTGTDFLQLGVKASHNRRGLVLSSGAFFQGLETKEEHPLIRTRAVKAVATNH